MNLDGIQFRLDNNKQLSTLEKQAPLPEWFIDDALYAARLQDVLKGTDYEVSEPGYCRAPKTHFSKI